jgi:hypothetical protein
MNPSESQPQDRNQEKEKVHPGMAVEEPSDELGKRWAEDAEIQSSTRREKEDSHYSTTTTPSNTSRDDQNPLVSGALDWSATIVIGFLVVSYWRVRNDEKFTETSCYISRHRLTAIPFLFHIYTQGTWTLLDIWTCDQPSTASMMNGESFCFTGVDISSSAKYASAWQTYLSGNLLLIINIVMMGMGWWHPNVNHNTHTEVDYSISHTRGALRFLMVYGLGAATVCIWHGIWYFLDVFLFPSNASMSRTISVTAGAGLCYLLMAGNALLAPPALFIVDGPSYNPPPIAVSILQSYRSIALPVKDFASLPRDPTRVIVTDSLVSYILLPWGVVGFWRGMWYMMDALLWNGTSTGLHWSIVYSYCLGIVCLVLTSEDVVRHFPTTSRVETRRYVLLLSQMSNQLFGRFRTLVLAFGAVNFWRAVWLTWDEWMGSTSTWSAALAHSLAVVLLTAAGCLSCITAPPSTLGVDAVAHPGTSHTYNEYEHQINLSCLMMVTLHSQIVPTSRSSVTYRLRLSYSSLQACFKVSLQYVYNRMWRYHPNALNHSLDA